MKYGIDISHNVAFDGGAVGILNENVVVKEVGTKVIAKLRQLGHTVIPTLPTSATSTVDSLLKRCTTANTNHVDQFICIHANIGGGKGSETFSMSPKGAEIGNAILKELNALGYVNRGVKDGSRLYVIRNTNAPACLVELFFLDNQEDCNKYDSEKLANAIVKGLTGQTIKSAPVYPGYVIKYKPDFYDKNTELIQRRLGIIADGYFGNATKSAVIRFQNNVGLSADGEVGINTWTKLFN